MTGNTCEIWHIGILGASGEHGHYGHRQPHRRVRSRFLQQVGLRPSWNLDAELSVCISFLVADRVYVSSLAAKSSHNPEPTQYVFSSGADESSFEIYPDPRGNTLGRGTEITLILKDEAIEYMDQHRITDLV